MYEDTAAMARRARMLVKREGPLSPALLQSALLECADEIEALANGAEEGAVHRHALVEVANTLISDRPYGDRIALAKDLIHEALAYAAGGDQ